MYDHQLFVRTLSDFTRVLLTPYDIHTALGELADRVTDVLGLAGSGVSLARGDRLEFGTAYGSAIAEVERTQERFQAGPCVTAFKTGKIVAVTDVAACTDEWPDYCAAAKRAGISAVASLPMRLDETEPSVGALNLYADGPRDWPDDDLAAAVVMADMATTYLINASHHRKQIELAQQLQDALNSRVLIEQAKGALAARLQIAPDQAFDRLRRYARSRGVRLTSVAEAVVHHGLDP
jgi:GAF domain-containing protein